MSSTILAANINADGTVAQNPTGGIRTVQKGKEQGTYNIVFSTPFIRPPVVVATQNYPSWNSALSDHGWPGDNAVIIYVNETSVGVLTGQHDKTIPRNFSVLIVGNTST